MRAAIRRQLFGDIGRSEPLAFDNRWTEVDEIKWLDNYAKYHPHNAIRYCDLVLNGMRRWDETVNVGHLLFYVGSLRIAIEARENRKLVAIKPHPDVVAAT